MIIHIKVIPKSFCNRIEYNEEVNFYKVKVTDPPISGKANQKVIKLLADYFNTSKNNVKIKFGRKSRVKTVEIDYSE